MPAERTDSPFHSDGVECAAWLYTPEGAGPHPCVVMAPGFGAVREQRLDAYAERFAAAGMAVLLDKLSERLAFERMGTRLYDALINKCELLGESAPGPTVAELRQIREEERQHFLLVNQAITSLGGDPTLRVPRRADPRERVPAGSVALAGEYCAIYPRASPGG